VWEALLNANPYLSSADKEAIARQTELFTTTVGNSMEGLVKIDVDKQRHSIAIEGQWWYRGIHTAEPHQKGSRLVYSVYNIAPSATRWMAQLVQGPQNARNMPQQLRELLDAIGSQLHCTAYLTSQ
jgi:hypothetical protein